MKHICFFGDGITQGLGDSHRYGWPERLAALEHAAAGEQENLSEESLALYNLSVAWDSSADIAFRWQTEAIARLHEHHQAGVVFCFGQGDMAECDDNGVQVSLWDSAAYAESLLCEASMLWPVLWIGPPPVAAQGGTHYSSGKAYSLTLGRVQAINDAYAEIAARKGLPYLDLIKALSRNRDWQDALHAGGGLFPRSAGHQAIAEAVQSWEPWRRWMEKGLGHSAQTRAKELPPKTLLTPKMVAAGY